MPKVRKSSDGFSVVEVFLVAVALISIGLVGWYVWQARGHQVSQQLPAISSGSKSFSSTFSGVSFQYPASLSPVIQRPGKVYVHGGNESFYLTTGTYHFSYYDTYSDPATYSNIEKEPCTRVDSAGNPFPCYDYVILRIDRVDSNLQQKALIVTYYTQDLKGKPVSLKTALAYPISSDTTPVLGVNKANDFNIDFDVPTSLKANGIEWSNAVVLEADYNESNLTAANAKDILSSSALRQVMSILQSVKFRTTN